MSVGQRWQVWAKTSVLKSLIGKQAAIIADARLGSRADQAVVGERLLTISGEDIITVDRKFRPAWTGRLPVRFIVLTNELPRLSDVRRALLSLFIVWLLTESLNRPSIMRTAARTERR
jgi:putative DNA primase/helicase